MCCYIFSERVQTLTAKRKRFWDVNQLVIKKNLATGRKTKWQNDKIKSLTGWLNAIEFAIYTLYWTVKGKKWNWARDTEIMKNPSFKKTFSKLKIIDWFWMLEIDLVIYSLISLLITVSCQVQFRIFWAVLTTTEDTWRWPKRCYYFKIQNQAYMIKDIFGFDNGVTVLFYYT